MNIAAISAATVFINLAENNFDVLKVTVAEIAYENAANRPIIPETMADMQRYV